MPYKNGKSFKALIKRSDVEFKTVKTKIRGLSYRIAAAVGARADQYVPLDTAHLVNSRTIRTKVTAAGVTATLGYYTDYAAALHENDNWRPRPPGTPGKPTGGYNPAATSDWIIRGVNEVDIEAMIKGFANK